MRPFAALLGAAGLLLAGCGNGGREADVCANADHELDASSCVFLAGH